MDLSGQSGSGTLGAGTVRTAAGAPPVTGAEAVREAVAEARRTATAVVPVGARTQWGVGGPAPEGTPVRAPGGIVAYQPDDLTVTVGAGTAVQELDATLAERGQECPLDPRDPAATVGGVLACGLSGHRRMRHGPVRDRVLEVVFVTGEPRVVKGGGPTVKNVSGYDLPRLLVGTLGSLGVLVQVTLRCVPRPPASRWFTTTRSPDDLFEGLYRPASLLWDGRRSWCLLEGHDADVTGQADRLGLEAGEAPVWPEGPYRGRISVRPSGVGALTGALASIPNLRWVAETGVGTVHVAGDGPQPLRDARRLAHEQGGWMVREAGDDLDGFGVDLPAAAIHRRLRAAFDPAGILNPGRLPV